MKNIILFAKFSLIIGIVHAQNGFFRGKIIDETSGEPLLGATVVKQGTTIGAVADFDGNFSLQLPVGSHNILFQSVGFQDILVEGVLIKAGETTILDVVMKEDVQALGEVVVTAEVIKDSDAGLLVVQKKSINTVDGISASTFRRVGDRDLSSAMKRVTGVTVQGGKYVYVRGLGDRYSKTALNGMIVPGLDPDRNDVQIDIFPTGVLENVVVYKTFTPDLVGDFAGGLIDIQTKAFPEEKTTSVSVGLGFNPEMHFVNDFLAYDGSATDFLGFDNGQRDLPVDKSLAINNPNEELTRRFDPVLAGTRQSSTMNSRFSFIHRNQIQGKKLTWGYNALFTYRNNVNFYKGYERNQFLRQNLGDDNVDVLRDFSSRGDLASREVLWSGLASLAAKKENMTIGANLLHIQNGVSTALSRTISFSALNNPNFIYNDILSYTERKFTDAILFGKHQLSDKFRLEWSNSLILSSQEEPDYRDSRIAEPERDGNYDFSNGGQVERFWRELVEVNESFKLDLNYDLNERNKIKLGGLFTYRDRDFRLYEYEYFRDDRAVTSTDANALLVPDNLYPNTNFHILSKTSEANSYDGNLTVVGAYAMNQMQITDKLKSIYGARFEIAKMRYTGIVDAPDGSFQNLDNATTLDEANILPSLSFIYAVNDDLNIRASYNKTLARPSFKEKSEVFIDDPVSDLIFIGNIDIRQAEINNYDVRGEYFFRPGEMVSLSFFYKDFTDHIALVAFELTPNQITPRNVGSAFAYGAEFEIRKRLDFISSSLRDFSFGSNISLVKSVVDRTTVPVNQNGTSEYESEVSFLGTDQGVKRERNMSMQAPYSINGFINYEPLNGRLSANLSYNVQGETLTYVSASEVPEVFTRPFHSLNLRIARSFGEEKNSSLSITVRNILDDENELFYKTAGIERTFSRQLPGRQFSVGYTYNF